MALQTTTSIVDYLKSQKKPSDFASRGKLYVESGLEARLGAYRGTGQQNVALLKFAQKPVEPAVQPALTSQTPLPTPTPQPTPQPTGQQVLTRAGITAPLGSAEATRQILERGNILGREMEQQTGIPFKATPIPPIIEQAIQREREIPASIQETMPPALQPAPEPTLQAPEPSPEPVSPPIPTQTPAELVEAVKLADTDLDQIMTDVSTGAITTPELEISQEAKRLAMAGEERKVSQVLKQFQQQMAKRGMTFSGIRTEGEKNIMAESLARKSGISLGLASTILDAARSEQSRREAANREAQKASESALKAMGYVMSPTGELVRTLEREKFEEKEPSAPKVIGSAETGYFQWSSETGSYEPIAEIPKTALKPTADIQEYEYAKEQGYAGTFEDWQQMSKPLIIGASQWAAELGVAGMPISEAIPILQSEAQKEKKTTKEREIASVRANIYKWIDTGQSLPQNILIDQLVSAHESLSREQITSLIELEMSKQEKMPWWARINIPGF